MYYIIAGHGAYAEACKSSCEMITGAAPSFVPVIFTDDMTKEAVEQKYEEILAEKGADQCAAIIADLPGGTPYNAAMRIVAEHKNIQLTAGLCQQLLVLLNSGENLADAIAQTGEIFGNAGVKKDVRKAQAKAPAEPVEKNGIVNFRLDERLIHGQVATYWTRTLQADRIIVADDDVLKDQIGMEALKAAVPSGVHLSILSVDNAAKRLNEGRYSGQRVFLIVNKPKTISRMLDAGLKVKEVNIGNMGEKEGRKQIKKSVYCTPDEIAEIKSMEEKGVQVYAQMVPNDEKKTFESYLN
nr:PTS mannose/fructose/sorbose transporter subunit IIAB [uncultured Mediterraneibacter sp.]